MSRSPLEFRCQSFQCRHVAFFRFWQHVCQEHACTGDKRVYTSQHARPFVAIAMWAQFVTSLPSLLEIVGDTDARITAEMKLKSSLLHMCPIRAHGRPTRTGACSACQCTIVGSEFSQDLRRIFHISTFNETYLTWLVTFVLRSTLAERTIRCCFHSTPLKVTVHQTSRG